jgi:hypothetical protein
MRMSTFSLGAVLILGTVVARSAQPIETPEPRELPTPVIKLTGPIQTQPGSDFTATVSIPETDGPTESAVIRIVCTPSDVRCEPDMEHITLPAAISIPVKVSPMNFNSVEIDAQVEAHGKNQPATPRFVDLGLSVAFHSLGNDIPAEGISAGDSVPIGFWLEDKDHVAQRADSGIQITVKARDKCLLTQTVELKKNPDEKAFKDIPFQAFFKHSFPRMNQMLYVRAPMFGAGKCVLDVALSTGEGQFDRPTVISIIVRPYWPIILLMCTIGSLSQLVFAGLTRLAAANRKTHKKFVDLVRVFLGQKGSQPAEFLLKGLGGGVIALLLEYTKLVHFGSIDASSKLGYAVFGFLIGFWDVDSLVSLLRSIAHGGNDLPQESARATSGNSAN